MPNPATVSDVTVRWLYDAPVPAETTVQAWLDDAWGYLLTRDRTIETRLTAGTLDESDVTRVVVAMAMRVLGNPQGKRQEAIDDYSWTRDSAVSAGLLYVTAEELAGLAAPGGRTNSVRLVAYGDGLS
jgi:hypothetical protein